MKRKVLLILFAGFICSMVTLAQESNRSFYQQSLINRLFIELDVTGSTTNKDTRLMSLGGKVGFDITPNLYVFAKGEGLMALRDANGMKSYGNGANLGGGLGVRFLKINFSNGKSSFESDMSVYAMMAASVGNTDWKQTVYEAGLKWKLGKRLAPTLGLGFRHTNSHTVGVPNHNGMVGSIGICF